MLSRVTSAAKYWLGFGWVGSLFGKGGEKEKAAAARPFHDFSDPGGMAAWERFVQATWLLGACFMLPGVRPCFCLIMLLHADPNAVL